MELWKFQKKNLKQNSLISIILIICRYWYGKKYICLGFSNYYVSRTTWKRCFKKFAVTSIIFGSLESWKGIKNIDLNLCFGWCSNNNKCQYFHQEIDQRILIHRSGRCIYITRTSKRYHNLTFKSLIRETLRSKDDLTYSLLYTEQ